MLNRKSLSLEPTKEIWICGIAYLIKSSFPRRAPLGVFWGEDCYTDV